MITENRTRRQCDDKVRVSVFVAMFLLGSVLAPPAEAQYESVESIFVLPNASAPGRLAIDPDPERAFLEVSFTGADSNERWDYSYYGDGRVTIDRYFDHRSDQSSVSWMSQLSVEESIHLLRELANNRLYEFEPNAELAAEASRGVARSIHEDAGVRFFRFSLTKLAPDSDDVLGIIVNQFWVPGGVFMPGAERGAPEFEALRRILNLGRELRSRAHEVVP